MLDLNYPKPYRVGLYPGYDAHGMHQLTCIIKAEFSFDLHGNLTVVQEPQPIVEVDEYLNKPHYSSLIAASEIMPFKKGGEIYLLGIAYPSANSVAVEASLVLEQDQKVILHKTLRIVGERYWRSSFFGLMPSKPKLLAPLPLIYEHAYGGHALNPAGIGYSELGWGLKNKALPQIELVPRFVQTVTDKPPPAGFGPIPATWQLETTQTQYFYGKAPQDQRFALPFKGNEKIILSGLFAELSPQKKVALQIETQPPHIVLNVESKNIWLQPTCDTLIINTNNRTLQQLWRVGIAWDVDDQRSGAINVRESYENCS